METNEIDKIISRYVGDNFSPTDNEKDNISVRYKQLEKILVGVDIFQSGSYARFTAITPVNDLDVIWVIPEQEIKLLFGENAIKKVIDAEDLDVKDILNDLANKLKEEYKKLGVKVRIVPQSHSVGIYFGPDDEFSIDVVPAIELSEKSEGFDVHLYKVPNILKYKHWKRQKIYASGESISWIKSDPRGYKEQAKELDEETGGTFRKTVKLVKKWRQTCRRQTSNFKLKSFHLEIIITNHLLETPQAGISESVIWLYRELPIFLANPQIVDRADSDRYIDDYLEDLTDQQREIIRSYKDKAVITVQKLHQAESKEEVIKVVKELTTMTSTGGSVTTPPTYTINSRNRSKPWMGE